MCGVRGGGGAKKEAEEEEEEEDEEEDDEEEDDEEEKDAEGRRGVEAEDAADKSALLSRCGCVDCCAVANCPA